MAEPARTVPRLLFDRVARTPHAEAFRHPAGDDRDMHLATGFGEPGDGAAGAQHLVVGMRRDHQHRAFRSEKYRHVLSLVEFRV